MLNKLLLFDIVSLYPSTVFPGKLHLSLEGFSSTCDAQIVHECSESQQCTPRTAVCGAKRASCPGGRSCHPRPRLMHRFGMFTHLDSLSLPPAGSHRLNIPHTGLGTSLWCSSWRLHMFFSYPVSRRSWSQNTN